MARSTQDIAIVGAGGFASEVEQLIYDINSDGLRYRLVAILADPAPNSIVWCADESVALGSLRDLDNFPSSVAYTIAIGDPATRRRLDTALGRTGRQSPVLIHPAATVGRSTTLGSGTIVCAGARMTSNIGVGRAAHVNLNSTIGHDVRIGDYVTISPMVAVSGNVSISSDVFIGTSASILPGIDLGAGCTVGAGAAVTRDVAVRSTAVGVPAKPR